MTTRPRAILITGCSSGIGYHCAHALRARGWQVFASCRAEVDCARLRAEGSLPRRCYACQYFKVQPALLSASVGAGG